MAAPPPPLFRDFAKDLYRLLRLPRTASHADIKRSYREMAMDLHPDRHGHNCDKRTAEFREMSEAYRILCDRHARAEYDRWLDGADIGADGRVVRRSRAAERNPHYRKVYSPAAPPGMKTFDRQRHFGEYHGTSRESLFAHSSAFRFFFLGGVGDVRARRDTAPLHRAGDGVFFFCGKGLRWGRGPGRRLRLPSRLPEQFAHDPRFYFDIYIYIWVKRMVLGFAPCINAFRCIPSIGKEKASEREESRVAMRPKVRP